MACLAFTPNCFWNCDGDIPVTFLNWDIKLDKLYMRDESDFPTDSRNLHFVFQ